MDTPSKPTIYVTVLGEQMPVRFGMAALFDFTKALGITVGDLQRGFDFDALDLEDLGRMYLAGFRDGHRKASAAGTPPLDWEIEDMADVMDELSEADSAAILELFTSSQGAAGKGKPKAAATTKAKPKAKTKRAA